jgi:hypothetical protein
MLTFSRDAQVAEQQMKAIIFYLTTFGYIDGHFDDREKAFVRAYIEKLVRQRVETGMPEADAKLKAELTQKFTTHFLEVFEGIDRHVKDLFTEAVAADEEQDKFVHTKLKLRCYEIFQGFDRASQEALLDAVDEFIYADGEAHPAEVKLRAEISSLLEQDLGIELVEHNRPSIELKPRTSVEVQAGKDTHPFFEQFEYHYSRDPEKIAKQISADRALLDKVIDTLAAMREKGQGKLAGKQKVTDFAGEAPFLDGHTYVVPPNPAHRYELIVLGDLHGCYSNLKAAIMQSRFFEKVEAFKKDPANEPNPKLVLLGDYIDRGMFSLNGVLRTVMQVFVTAPDHVFLLRGNHEYYLEYKGQIYGGVKPAESINTLKGHLPLDVFRHYMKLFDALPNVLLFDGVMFVHGGIPRDLLVKERWKDMSALNDPDIRFQMMWSDPSSADVIPAELQEQSARFPFGRLQAAAFLQRMGCHTLIRGHEKVVEGFKYNYDDEDVVLITLFSSGGITNDDLPTDSSYREVEPHALTVSWAKGELQITPWPLDYERYNDPEKNKFFERPPEIQHKAD